ncbi:TonB-dependent receptor [Asticcacaulis sp. EMRT-3]|uniref:TonB-dependent receptor n=1 Tax=Asticcacaulis sp. EMRT-3 TaxID=3040349 RepID=UPI0024AFD459|nr:TonB-dependent receptor [Asticcacaulis sp. EMRT-3]MDI7776516.1 TonB-dependent receptor [Asticcacaulis sp. EMRT-3]
MTSTLKGASRLAFGASPAVLILALTLAPGASMAQTSAAQNVQTVPIETIVVTGKAETAPAPGSTPLSAVEPTSIVSAAYIAKNLAPSGNYDEAIKFSPSTFDTAPNGPGLAESQNISIRGFQDGQFNVTFDGIPWGDSNDFTHHTTSYFMAHDLGQITIDRGPGTGATIGNATFGGTVYILSKAPEDHFAISPYVSYGSFNTSDVGVEVDSGKLNNSGTRFLIDAEGLQSDGYLTNEHQKRQNYYAKLVQPLGDNFTLTLAGMYNHVHQNISIGSTADQLATLGRNWGLSRDPNNQNYFDYNADFIKTDFIYADLAGHFGEGWSLDGKLYTYAYGHTGINGEDPNGEYPNYVVLTQGGPQVSGVPGQLLKNDYRSVGAILRLTKILPFGDLQTGLWYDSQTNLRRVNEVVMNENMSPNYDDNGNGAIGDPGTGATNGFDRDLTQGMKTFQPYIQFNIKPLAGLTLTPGIRYSWFRRNVNANVNVKTETAQSYKNTFQATLPSLEAHYDISANWSAYAQAAKGFLAPNENYFNRVDPNSTNFKPESTTNYQAGTTWKNAKLSASLDVYAIDFNNLIVPVGSQGGKAIYGNLGGVRYRGIEAEGSYAIGHGFSLYANASINSAIANSDKTWVPNTPKNTASGGVVYNSGGVYASLFAKMVGPRYGDSGDTQRLPPFTTADASIDFDLGRLSDTLASAKLKINVNNIADSKPIINLAGYTVGAGTPLYWTNAGRSIFATLEFKFGPQF